MRGFGGLTEAVDALLGSFGVSVQPWFFPALLAACFVLLFPQFDKISALRRRESRYGAQQMTAAPTLRPFRRRCLRSRMATRRPCW